MKKYADSTLKQMTKDELIDYIRMIECNYDSLEEFYDRQTKLLEDILRKDWHNIKENPSDLPLSMGSYLCIYVEDKTREYKVGNLVYINGKFYDKDSNIKEVEQWDSNEINKPMFIDDNKTELSN